LVVDAMRGKHRVWRSAGSLDASRALMKSWFANHRSTTLFARFASHFDVLDRVLTQMLDVLARDLAAIDDAVPAGDLYDRCARLDTALAVVVRLFEWYAAKYDQRCDTDLAPTLLAADEVVRSCWSEPFARLGVLPPTGPLVYLDAQFDAFATPRVSVPSDLRARADSLVADYLRELPIPTIALPSYAVREAWWLVLAAHETGHHVQKDLLPDLETATRTRLMTAVAASDVPSLTSQWAKWAAEAFADAYSTLMTGGAAVWAIDELQYSTPAQLFKPSPAAGRYPPPAVRLALLSECQRAAGQPVDWPTAEETADWLRKLDGAEVPAGAVADILDQLKTVPTAADALMSLPIGTEHLRDLGSTKPDLLTQPPQLSFWAEQLAQTSPALPPLTDRGAARLIIAAGVTVWRAWADRPEAASVLPIVQDNLLRLLPRCGPPGFLTQPPAAADVTDLAERLAGRLLRETLHPESPDQAGR
jgi:hypothetical protein